MVLPPKLFSLCPPFDKSLPKKDRGYFQTTASSVHRRGLAYMKVVKIYCGNGPNMYSTDRKPLRERTRPRSVCCGALFLVRPTGFEPAAFRVGELRHPNRNGVQARFLVAFAQVCPTCKTPAKPFPMPVGGALRCW